MRLSVARGREGEVALPEREARAAGLGASAEWRALPGLGLLSPPESGAWLAGTLAAASFAEVAQLLSSSLRTGILHLALGAARRAKAVHFRDGQVVFASSSDPGDRLGPALARLGLASAEALDRCAPRVKAGRHLGQLLVDQGALTPGQLYDAVAAQVREIFLSSFEVAEGEFLFREEPLDERSAVRLPERTRDLILAGLKRAERAEQEAAPPEAQPLASAPPPPPGPPGPVPSAPGGGPFEAYRRLFRAIHGAVSGAVPDAGRRLDSWLERLPEGRRAPFDGVRFGASGEVDVHRVLDNVVRTGRFQGAMARARALEALESLLSYALFEAGNLLSREDAGALRREMGRIQMGGEP